MEDFAVCKASLPYPSLVRRNSTLFRFEKEGTKRRFSVGKVFSPQCRKTALIVLCQAFDRKTQHFNKQLGNECIFESNKVAILKCVVRPRVLENHFSPTLFFVRPSHLLCMQSTWARARTEFWSWDSVEESEQNFRRFLFWKSIKNFWKISEWQKFWKIFDQVLKPFTRKSGAARRKPLTLWPQWFWTEMIT